MDHFEAKSYVEGLRFAPIRGSLESGMAVLQLCRWKFSKKNFVADYSTEIKLYFKK